MKRTGLYILAGIMAIAFAAPLCHADNLAILLHSVRNNSSQSTRPPKDVGPRKQMNDAVAQVVVSEMTLLRSFFLMFSPDPKDAGVNESPPKTRLR